MALEFRLPDLGEGIAEGEITTWLVREGQRVAEDQPMVEVMTDKATVEITSPRAGTVLKLLVEEGTTVAIGTTIVIIGDPGEQPASVPEAAVPEAAVPPVGMAAGTRPGEKALAAPSVRRLARERGLDIDRIPGSGPAGRVLAADVDAFLRGGSAPTSPAAVPAGGEERFKLKGIRKRITEVLSEAVHKAVHVTHIEEVDAGRLISLREAARPAAEAAGVKVTFLPFIMKALIEALKRFPMFNATLDEERGEIVWKRYYHIGIAVATDRGCSCPWSGTPTANRSWNWPGSWP
jgi:pyruvate/2-oxoglutarate dehydrogenase complex dihydrolipoamide acyltransferase (E2) component